MRTLVLGAAMTACLAGSALAADQSHSAWLALKTRTGVDHVVLDGALWTCASTTCKSERVKAPSGEAACQQLSARFGELTAFRYRQQLFTPQALAACNAGAKAG